ncbi:hypothetical protein ACFS5L_17415 [Streptomyces phyllanthi]|uniref:Uncharacterized protein n=1 Tax=Streptomyces phyllanthi TaxID=1803180 RepID=A0A5N8VXK3_9ACTN|nr:hypothetical protein [Streptomyces phyllanthi]MPY38665.1 hypothetical protein [Streptomyces phyllanthi]
MSLANQHRMSVLHIDRDADLPLMYLYLPEQNMFRTMGYVRLRGVTVRDGMSRVGPDTDGERDAFLLEVLTALLVPSREARRIVRTATHIAGRDGPVAADDRSAAAGPGPFLHAPRGVPSPAAGRQEMGGTHLVGPGAVVGLVCGLLVGLLLAGWNGAAIGAFVGMSTFPHLFMGGWQAVHARSPRNYVEIHDTVALLLVAAGTVAGAVLGHALGSEGFARARGVFLGMALAAFALGLLATAFSMVPFRQRSMTWLGPLVVGGFAWGAHSLWSSPVALALGIVLGVPVAGALTRRVSGVG